MRLISFGAKNFLGYSELELKLAGLDPLILIDGRNHDFADASSNGSGKSSISECIAYALFGKTIRNVEARYGKESIIHTGAKGGTSVWLEAELPTGKLRIERYRQHPEYENKIRAWLDGQDVIRGRVASETDDRIAQLLGFDYDLFCRAVVIHSRLTESFSTVENRYIKSITERLLGLRDFDGLRKYVKGQVDKCGSETAQLEIKLSNTIARLEELESELEALQEKQKTHQHEQSVMGQRLAQEIKACSDKTTQFSKTHSIAKESADKFQGQLDKLNRERQKIKDAASEQDAVKIKAERKQAELGAELRIATQQAQRYTNMSGKTCPECDQVVSAAHVKAKVKELENRLIDLKRKVKTALTVVTTQAESVVKTKQELEQLDNQCGDLRNSVSNSERDAATIAEKLRNERIQLKRLQEQKEELAVDPYAELIANVKALSINKENELAKAQADLKDQEERKRYTEFWLYAFSPNGMRSFMLDGATPMLNQLANFYLEQLTDNTMALRLNTVKSNKDGTYKDKFDIDVTNESGANVLGGNSDGETGCVDLALNLAMSDLLESRIKGGIGLLFIDQALDLLDSSRAALAVRLLRQKTESAWCKEHGIVVKDHVFLISHKLDIQDSFNSVLYVEKHNGTCRLGQKA